MREQEEYRAASDGARIFVRRWSPEGAGKATVVLVHGVGEHSGRYVNVGQHFARAGHTLVGFDLRGHGKSDGRRGDARFGSVFLDLDGILAAERGRNGPLFLYGHSLGGLIALAYALDRRPAIEGIVASGAALHTSLREQRAKVMLVRALGSLLPEVAIRTGLQDTLLTRDREELAAYRADPLVHEKATLGMARDVLAAADRVLRDAAEIGVPVLLIHGGADQVNYLSGSEHVARKLGRRATLRVYDGVLHKPHKDPESPRVLDDVVAWFEGRLAGGREQASA